MAEAKSHIWTGVDYERDGKQVGTLNMEWSVTRSAYGIVPVPVAVVRNGAGPTLLLMAGNHGDEYEGQVLLTRLIRSLDPARVRGRIIILPAANVPAAIDGARLSPLDQGNLNRSFPGEPLGPPTGRLAHYIGEVLMPMCDAFFDLHSGGASLLYLPYVHADLPGTPEGDAKARAALAFINPRLGVAQPIGAASGMAADSALRHGVISLNGEFAGAGAISAEALAVAERSLHRLLAHLEIMPLDPRWENHIETRWMTFDKRHYLFAPADGLFVPARKLGEEVKRGEPAGELLFPEDPERMPVEVVFPATGLFACIRPPARVRRGDCLGHLFVDV